MAFAIAGAAAITGASPMPFAPNGPSGAGTSTISVSISGALGDGDRVVEERAGLELPVVVVRQLLEEGPADALRRASPHLSFDERRVQGAADVLRDRVTKELDLARLAVDADVGQVSRHGRRAPPLRRAPVPLDGLVATAEALRLRGDLLDRDRALRRSDRSHDTVDDLEVEGAISSSSDAASSSFSRAASAARSTAAPTVYVTFDLRSRRAGPDAVSAETIRTRSGSRRTRPPRSRRTRSRRRTCPPRT